MAMARCYGGVQAAAVLEGLTIQLADQRDLWPMLRAVYLKLWLRWLSDPVLIVVESSASTAADKDEPPTIEVAHTDTSNEEGRPSPALAGATNVGASSRSLFSFPNAMKAFLSPGEQPLSDKLRRTLHPFFVDMILAFSARDRPSDRSQSNMRLLLAAAAAACCMHSCSAGRAEAWPSVLKQDLILDAMDSQREDELKVCAMEVCMQGSVGVQGLCGCCRHLARLLVCQRPSHGKVAFSAHRLCSDLRDGRPRIGELVSVNLIAARVELPCAPPQQRDPLLRNVTMSSFISTSCGYAKLGIIQPTRAYQNNPKVLPYLVFDKAREECPVFATMVLGFLRDEPSVFAEFATAAEAWIHTGVPIPSKNSNWCVCPRRSLFLPQETMDNLPSSQLISHRRVRALGYDVVPGTKVVVVGVGAMSRQCVPAAIKRGSRHCNE
jgi:hypothetical protein